MKFYAWLTFICGLTLSSLAGFFSVVGLAKIFAGSFNAVVALGAALEIAKLVAVAWLYRFRHLASKPVRIYFYAATLLLMAITSLGIFGYLSRAHVDMEASSITAQLTLDEISQREANLKQQQTQLSTELNSLNNQSDKLVEQLGANNRLTRENGAVQVQRETANRKAALLESIQKTNDAIQSIQKERIAKQTELGKTTADIGPLRYVAQAIYGNDSIQTIQRAIVWLILLLMVVFDPMAIMLLIASNILFKHMEDDMDEDPQDTILPKAQPLLAPAPHIPMSSWPGATWSTTEEVYEKETAESSKQPMKLATKKPKTRSNKAKKASTSKKEASKPVFTQTPANILKTIERASVIPPALAQNDRLSKEAKKIVDN